MSWAAVGAGGATAMVMRIIHHRGDEGNGAWPSVDRCGPEPLAGGRLAAADSGGAVALDPSRGRTATIGGPSPFP
ncbi:hypothetical protein CKO22_08755 [Thiococcus pfennigii]|nr:hypothetical protein [Thiococcus pfennigii]